MYIPKVRPYYPTILISCSSTHVPRYLLSCSPLKLSASPKTVCFLFQPPVILLVDRLDLNQFVPLFFPLFSSAPSIFHSTLFRLCTYSSYFLLSTFYFILHPCASRQNRVFITRQTAYLTILYDYSPQTQLPVRLFDRRYILPSFHPNFLLRSILSFPFLQILDLLLLLLLRRWVASQTIPFPRFDHL